jgi:hypothetical protein
MMQTNANAVVVTQQNAGPDVGTVEELVMHGPSAAPLGTLPILTGIKSQVSSARKLQRPL